MRRTSWYTHIVSKCASYMHPLNLSGYLAMKKANKQLAHADLIVLNTLSNPSNSQVLRLAISATRGPGLNVRRCHELPSFGCLLVKTGMLRWKSQTDPLSCCFRKQAFLLQQFFGFPQASSHPAHLTEKAMPKMNTEWSPSASWQEPDCSTSGERRDRWRRT